MTVPTDFPSFAAGFDLTSANYSTPGVGGGVFANLVSDEDAWVTGSNVPSFSTFSGLEGMNFANSVNSAIQGRMRAMSEFTVLAIGRVGTTGSNPFFGGFNPSAETAALECDTGGLLYAGTNAYNDFAAASGVTTNTTFIAVGSWSPVNGTVYSQRNNGTPVTDSSWVGGASAATLGYWQAALGATRNRYLTGWLARVLIFSRALHYRDNANLQALILTEMASVGL